MDALGTEGLPPGWATARLSDLIEPPETVNPTTEFEGRAAFAYISLTSVEPGKVVAPEMIAPASAPGRARQRIRAGDTLFSCVRVYLEKVVRVPEALDGEVCSTAFAVLRPRPGIDPGYLHWLTRRPAFLRAAEERQKGNSPPAIQEADLRSIEVPVAPPAEQTRIVATVNTLFDEVEAGEAALARAREGLTQFRASLLHAACTGALTADWRAANPTNQTGHDLLADVLAKRRIRWAEGYRAAAEARGRRLDGDAWLARYPQPQPVTTENLEPLPNGWTWASLDELCVTMTSGSRAWAPYYDRGTSVFVMAQNVRPGRFDRNYVQLVDPPDGDPERIRTRIQRYDLLVTIVGANTGDVCRVDADVVDHYVCQSVALMRPVRADLAEYLDLFLNSERGGQAAFARMMYGAGRPHLSFDQLKSVAVPLPPLAEIAAILDAVREAWIEADALMPEGFASSLRQAILHAAITGRLVPQDPTDEPAAALLARLRAAPAAARRPRARRTATQPDLIETPA